ncbi:MAG: hypothetical protein NC416_04450 [Eubacterium sp.]|nr:hypothetical protein [Eubacterium sp.]
MAAGCVFAKVMCAIGIIAAVAVLILWLGAFAIWLYWIKYWDEFLK